MSLTSNSFKVDTTLLNTPTSGTNSILLTSAMSGSIFSVNKATLAIPVTLPTPGPTTAGLSYRFINGAVATSTGTVVIGGGNGTNANISGIYAMGSGAGTSSSQLVNTASATVTITATSLPGDNITMFCDGSRWRCSGASGVLDGISMP